jgi:predicted nucleic acid-binding protein
VRLAVFDTNVIVSAGINADGAPAKLVMEWALDGAIHMVTCPAVVKEYRMVAQRRKFLRHGFPPLWLEFLIEESMHLPDPPPWPQPVPDATDLPFLALASQTGAWLVTGNESHFPREIRGGVTVVTPAEYLEQLTKSAPREL